MWREQGIGIGVGVGFANQRSLPPQGKEEKGKGRVLNVCFFTLVCRVGKSWEVLGMKGKVSSRVKDLRKVCVKGNSQATQPEAKAVPAVMTAVITVARWSPPLPLGR